MPIRVEHGPNLAPIGKLAYQTGQLEYRNKRRTELERIAMQQAEMRQKAQMQQRQLAQQAAIQQGNWGMDQQRIVANVKQNKQAHDNAMARLKQGQEFGVINADQANQWGLAAAENKREHDIFLADKSDQAIQDRAAAAAGIADQSALKRLGQKAIVDSYKNVFNPQGQQYVIGQLNRIEETKTDDRLTQEQKDTIVQQIHGELQDNQTNPLYTTLGPAGIGSVSPWKIDSDGRSLLDRVTMGEGVYEFKPPKTYKVEETNPETGVKSVVEKDWDPDEYFKATHKIVNLTGPDGRVRQYQRFLNEETGAWDTTELKDNTLEIVKAYGDYTSDFNSNAMNIANATAPLGFDEWKVSRGFGEQAAPGPAVAPGPQVAPTPSNEGDPNAPGRSTNYGMGPAPAAAPDAMVPEQQQEQAPRGENEQLMPVEIPFIDEAGRGNLQDGTLGNPKDLNSKEEVDEFIAAGLAPPGTVFSYPVDPNDPNSERAYFKVGGQ